MSSYQYPNQLLTYTYAVIADTEHIRIIDDTLDRKHNINNALIALIIVNHALITSQFNQYFYGPVYARTTYNQSTIQFESLKAQLT